MWMTFVSGLLVVALAIADNAPKVSSDATLPPGAEPGFDGANFLSMEQLVKILDETNDISDEEKLKLKEDLFKSIKEGSALPEMPAAGNDLTLETMILLSLLSLVALIFVFFVYKLFKVLSERKAKREEKKKIKQMKKKK